EPRYFITRTCCPGCIASMQRLSMNIVVAAPIIFDSSIREVIYGTVQVSQPPDSTHCRQRSHVRRGAVALGATRSNQWREAADRNHWRWPYRQHHRRALGQERAQSFVFLAPPGGIEGSGGGSRPAGAGRHRRSSDFLLPRCVIDRTLPRATAHRTPLRRATQG